MRFELTYSGSSCLGVTGGSSREWQVVRAPERDSSWAHLWGLIMSFNSVQAFLGKSYSHLKVFLAIFILTVNLFMNVQIV